MAVADIQVTSVGFSDNIFNIRVPDIEFAVSSTTSIWNAVMQKFGSTRRTLRRYSIDPIAGTYVDEFEVTHNKFESWEEYDLVLMLECTSQATLGFTPLTRQIGATFYSLSNVPFIEIVNVIAIFFEILAESAYTFPVFYRTRRVMLDWLIKSYFLVTEDVIRTRSITGDWIADGIFNWSNAYLYLKRRIYINIEPFAVLELLFTLWKEGNPAIRVEPIKWYKKRLDAGDIIIKENPWI